MAAVYLGYPAREWEDTVTGDGEDEAGSGDDGDGGVLNWVRDSVIKMRSEGLYQPQSDDANDVHKDVTTFAENDGIEGNEWLRGTKLHQLVRGGLIGILVHQTRNRR